MKPLISLIGLMLCLILGPTGVAVADDSTGSVGAGSSGNVAEQTQTATPIKHFISLMQENHSFDNYFGTYPGADGIPDGLCMPVDLANPTGDCISPFRIGNRAILDLGHNGFIHDQQFDGGKMDGFVSAFDAQLGVRDLPMGHYDGEDIPYYWNIADNYVLFDRNFTSAAGGSVWNHFFWATGGPGNTSSDSLKSEGFDDIPTIFDRLQEAGVDWKFYVQNYDPGITFRTPGDGDRASQIIWVPLLNYARFVDDPELNKHIVPMEEFYNDLRNNTLPAVSYMVPSGTSEHPPGSVQAGMRFVRGLINALQRSDAWDTSAFMWTYDDWGGWYDHVAPPAVDRYGYGFRAPALLVSAYAKQGYIDSTTIDFTSQLKFIESNWSVEPLASRDAAANNILDAFDFGSGPRDPIVLSESRERVVLAAVPSEKVYTLYGAAVCAPVVIVMMTRRRRARRLQRRS
ncbi:MAG: alkaline phosphatase family protein [Nakamurella sp.]